MTHLGKAGELSGAHVPHLQKNGDMGVHRNTKNYQLV